MSSSGVDDGAVTAFFAGHPLGAATCRVVGEVVDTLGPAEVRVTASQVAFRRRRGFAYLWLPGRWLRDPAADVVLSVVLDHRDLSGRWKQVAHPSPTVWMHHLEVQDPADVDDQVREWLREAYAAAG